MKIGIDIRSTLKPERTGIGQYTFNLLTALAKIDRHNQYFLYSRIKAFSRKRLPHITARNFHHFVERFYKKENLFFNKIDLLFSPSYDLLPPEDKKFVVTVHDLTVKEFPQGHTPQAIKEIEKSLGLIVDRADGIIVVSNNTKRDLLKWFKVSPEKIRVIHLGAGEEFYPLEEKKRNRAKKILRRYHIGDKFILFVGTLEPRKNLENLIRSYYILKENFKIDYKLVIVGMKAQRIDHIFSLVKDLRLERDIIFTGYLRGDLINYFYNLATIFVYPSLYEGFGLPIVEAFRVGTPVVTSNRSSCAEIGDGAAILVNPEDPREIAQNILEVINDKNLIEELRRKGLRRTKDFSWEVCAHKHLNFWTEIYKRKH